MIHVGWLFKHNCELVLYLSLRSNLNVSDCCVSFHVECHRAPTWVYYVFYITTSGHDEQALSIYIVIADAQSYIVISAIFTFLNYLKIPVALRCSQKSLLA